MPVSRKRKKKGKVGRPTPPSRPRTNLGALLKTSMELDKAEEELWLKEYEEKEKKDASE